MVLIIRGGPVADIDARLAKLHLPPLHGAGGTLPAPKVAFVWDPEVWGDPNVPGNSAPPTGRARPSSTGSAPTSTPSSPTIAG